MILNLTQDEKIFISCIVGAIWIYFREENNYKLLPRKNIFSIILVSGWIYFNYQEPLMLPAGLMLMYIYSKINKSEFNL